MDGFDQLGSALGDFCLRCVPPLGRQSPRGVPRPRLCGSDDHRIARGRAGENAARLLAAVGLIVSLSLTWPVTSAILR